MNFHIALPDSQPPKRMNGLSKHENGPWDLVHLLFDCFDDGLMSRDDFLALVEGEVLPAWAHGLHEVLTQKEQDVTAARELYAAWRRCLLGPLGEIDGAALRKPQLFLRSDAMVCR